MAPHNQGNMFVAVALSLTVLIGFHFFYEKPRLEERRRQASLERVATTTAADSALKPSVPESFKDRNELVTAGQRLLVESEALSGSIALTGARFDDLVLKRYRETLDRNSPAIILLSPSGSALPHPSYYAEFGWLADNIKVPDEQTVWQSDQPKLTPTQPVTLSWDNGAGLRFERVIAMDQDYLFAITDRIINTTSQAVTVHPFSLILHRQRPSKQDLALTHVGPMGVFDGVLHEHSYKHLQEEPEAAETSTGGWLGVSEKYWLAALIPNADEAIAARFRFQPDVGQKPEDGRYQVDFRGPPMSVAAAGKLEYQRRFFAGAKRVELLSRYAEAQNIEKFDLAIDFGWFRILTRPLLFTLNWLGSQIGNVGLAILVLTIIVKLLVLPLGIRSYRSMGKMKLLQPEMVKLQERFKDDRQRLSIEMMELYKREKISPLSGCLPILAQLPIFFALYKVLFIGIEMRHAPFFGWIQDLSAPDPTSLFNLFGLLPFAPPTFLHIGIWPLLMGLSMFLLQRMGPQPTDPIQKQVMLFMPLVFTVMFAPTMASGLIIYWTWSNLISIAQQFLIFRRMQKH
jgi:YidC/Oxa1 family membrane protein insertase